jgi:uncharacterized damage-inducible protein DinB
MSTETERIAEQLRLLNEGKAWLGPSLREILAGIDEHQARKKPIENGHSIWELVLHLTAWFRIARQRFTATETRDCRNAEDWPVPSGPWQSALDALQSEIKSFQQDILALSEARLDQSAPATEPQTFYVLLHGVIQHAAYHAGQIALLKKL